MTDIVHVFTSRELGRALRAERRAQGLTQQQLAGRVGIVRQTLIDLEQGKNVSLQVLMSVLAGLGKALRVVDARPSVEDVAALFADDDEDTDGKDQDAARGNAPRRGR